MSNDLPRLAVVYERGAVSPWEISVGLADLADIVFLVPDTAHPREILPALEELGQVLPLAGDPVKDAAAIQRVGAAGILTFSEVMLMTTAAIAAEAGLPYHSPDVAAILTDKLRQRELIGAAGVDDTRTYPLRSAADWPAAEAAVGLPAVLKPVHGAASFNTHAITSSEQAGRVVPAAFAAMAGRPTGVGEPVFVLEQFLQGRPSEPYGDYVSVEGMCGKHGITQLAVGGKLPLLRPFRETGHFWPSHLPKAEQAQILDLAKRAVQALGLTTGLTHTEIKLTPSGPRIIEVNGRLGGWVNGLSLASCGVDVVRLAGRIALDEDVEPPVLAPGRVHFVHNFLAPIAPGVIAGVHGQREVLEIPGIEVCRNLYRVGDRLPGGVTSNDLMLIWGAVATHDDMIKAVEQVSQVLAVDLRFEEGLRRITAADLREEAFARAA